MTDNPRKGVDKSKRKAEILAAAEKIFFKQGVSAASMDSVAKEANVSKGTLYLYFKNKNALYRAILRRAFETLDTFVRDHTSQPGLNGKDRVMAAGKAYVAFSKEYPGYFDSILHYENDNIGLDEGETESMKSMIAGNMVLETLAGFIKQGLEDGSITAKLHPLRQALLLWGSITGILQMMHSKHQLLNHYYEISEQEILDEYFNGVLNHL